MELNIFPNEICSLRRKPLLSNHLVLHVLPCHLWREIKVSAIAPRLKLLHFVACKTLLQASPFQAYVSHKFKRLSCSKTGRNRENTVVGSSQCLATRTEELYLVQFIHGRASSL